MKFTSGQYRRTIDAYTVSYTLSTLKARPHEHHQVLEAGRTLERSDRCEERIGSQPLHDSLRVHVRPASQCTVHADRAERADGPTSLQDAEGQPASPCQRRI